MAVRSIAPSGLFEECPWAEVTSLVCTCRFLEIVQQGVDDRVGDYLLIDAGELPLSLLGKRQKEQTSSLFGGYPVAI
jgi:hypothetical protein